MYECFNHIKKKIFYIANLNLGSLHVVNLYFQDVLHEMSQNLDSGQWCSPLCNTLFI